MFDDNLFPGKFKNPYPLLEIDSQALTSNVRLLRKITGSKVKILIPVKANAYGCGLGEMIKYFKANPPDYLGVANPYEALELRKLGWAGKILNLGGFFPDMAVVMVDYAITPAITDMWQIEALNKVAFEKNSILDVHIKLDLGMGRIGLKAEDIQNLIQNIRSAKNMKIKGIFTHFPSSDNQQSGSNGEILKKFHDYSGLIMESLKLDRNEVILHSANSYAVMMNPDSHLDMIRPGLSFYGYFAGNKDRENLSKEFPFTASLSLKASPISIRSILKNQTISYGETYTVSENEMSVGVIPLGYADGVPRALSNRISFNGYPLLGCVTMDQIMLGGLRELNQEIELIGKNCPPLESWADLAGTISYEIMVRLGDRIQRRLV